MVRIQGKGFLIDFLSFNFFISSTILSIDIFVELYNKTKQVFCIIFLLMYVQALRQAPLCQHSSDN
jgi:hypothetical protein